MWIVTGTRYYGRVDGHGDEYLATRFYAIQLLPLVPLGSFWVQHRRRDQLIGFETRLSGKSVAAAYCVRAKPGATVSTPLKWKELNGRLDPRELTIETVPRRIAKLGDIWSSALKTRNTGAAIRAAADR